MRNESVLMGTKYISTRLPGCSYSTKCLNGHICIQDEAIHEEKLGRIIKPKKELSMSV